MPDANISFEFSKVAFCKRLGNQPHVGVYLYFTTIADSDASAFLTAVLESKESEEDETGYVYSVSIDSKDAATLMH